MIVSDSPWQEFLSSMGKYSSACYIDYDNHYQLKLEGDKQMLKGIETKKGIMLMLVLTLLLTACGNGTLAVIAMREQNQHKVNLPIRPLKIRVYGK
ncbi:hypothetical protein BSK49_22880 [Paenibacillus odorifer]|uniref:Lipoprotein n=1 Tax=Paenibacillus odorifer TaxID=189426 RepID=A0ABX3GN03_9BACL|nr:hypothetical protein [Paenibacillus odorifer]OMD27625.1 hypothetical protein BSO21_19915 [Paenibacillus odorifer]OMD83967.1 hypothetical protein BSK49_22880 [Paenibacillus odorifer]